MLGLEQYYAAPNAVSRRMALAVSTVPRVAKVFVGDEPVVLLMAADANVLLGVVTNRWSGGVDKLLDRLLTSDADALYRRSGALEGVLQAGFVYLSYKATATLSRDAACCMVLRALLKGALLSRPKADSMLALKCEQPGVSWSGVDLASGTDVGVVNGVKFKPGGAL